MTEPASAAASARASGREELRLAAAADAGARAYYRAAGLGKLGGVCVTGAALTFLAHHLLRQQNFFLGALAAFASVFVFSLAWGETPWGVRGRVRAEARSLLRGATRMLRTLGPRLSPASLRAFDAALQGVRAALASGSAAAAVQSRGELERQLLAHNALSRKGYARSTAESLGGVLLVAVLLRAFVFEPFHIPSGSMIPTLLVGDFILVNKMAYGLRIPFTDPETVHKLGEGLPARGEVIVFMKPHDLGVDYVKRVIGLPGDRIDVRNNVVSVNGVVQARTGGALVSLDEQGDPAEVPPESRATLFTEQLGERAHPILVRAAPELPDDSYTVAPGHVFLMGDNRDNSSDSRAPDGFGQIPLSYIKGRASFIWLSFGGPHELRFERLFRRVR